MGRAVRKGKPRMTEQQRPQFKDRSWALWLGGGLLILIGLFCAGLVPLVIFARAVGLLDPALMSGRTMIASLATYALLAVMFIWLGIGSIRAKRWAQVLCYIVSWVWLLCGILAMVMVVFSLSDLVAQTSESSDVPPAGAAIISVTVLAVAGLIYVLLPAGLLLIYRNKNVAATCAARWPQPCWTDTCPPLILSLCIVYVLGAYSLLLMPCLGLVIPWFGILLTGAPAAAVLLLLLLVLAYLTRATYRLEPAAWWTAVAGTLVAALSTTITLVRVDPSELYQRMLPPQQAELVLSYGGSDPLTMHLVLAASWISFLWFLLYTRKYFRFQPEGEGTNADNQDHSP